MGERKAVFYLREMVEIFLRHRVSRSGAALSYYLTFALFPTLICIYALLSRFIPNPQDIVWYIQDLLPADTVETLIQYLEYVSDHTSMAMISAAIGLMVISSSAVFRELHSAIAEIQGKARFRGILYMLGSFLFGLLFLGAIYFGGIVLVTGRWFLQMVDQNIPYLSIGDAWNWVRFLLLFAILLMILYNLYRLLAPRDSNETVLPGAFFAAAVLVAVSILMSFFIGMFSRYPLVYGSLASVMILMLWLDVCGIIIIMGGAWNVVRRRWLERLARAKVLGRKEQE